MTAEQAPLFEHEVDPLDVEETVEVEEATEADESYYPVEYSISSYGADYPVDGLVKRIDAGTIYIPKFQRGYVWNIHRASRFIESLLLGLPVPAIFLSREQESNKMLVIDGQQRLRTLQFFYNGIFKPTETTFKLRGVQERFGQATYAALDEDDRIRLDDSILHAIIITQEGPKEDTETAPSSVYHIFERLNTGGVLLHPQEIRTCIYHGQFVDLLEELNKNPDWRDLFGSVSSRMRDRELILRFFAVYYWADSYSKPMKEFLTRFLAKYRNIEEGYAEELAAVFQKTTKICNAALGHKAFKPAKAVNAAVCEAVMIGVAERLKKGDIKDYAALKARYDALFEIDRFMQTISSSTTNDNNVADRLSITKDSFGDCP